MSLSVIRSINDTVTALETMLRLERALHAAQKDVSTRQEAVIVAPIGNSKSKAREGLRAAQSTLEQLQADMTSARMGDEDASWLVCRVANARLEQTDLLVILHAAESTLASVLEGAKSSAWKRKAVRGVEPAEPKDVLDARTKLQMAQDAVDALAERIAPDVFLLEKDVVSQATDAELKAWKESGYVTEMPTTVRDMLAREQEEFYALATPLVWTSGGVRRHSTSTHTQHKEWDWDVTAAHIQRLAHGNVEEDQSSFEQILSDFRVRLAGGEPDSDAGSGLDMNLYSATAQPVLASGGSGGWMRRLITNYKTKYPNRV